MRTTHRLTRTLVLCLAGLSCTPNTDSSPPSDADPSASVAQGVTAADAQYDPLLKAPSCRTPGARCDSLSLLTGRGTVGPESFAPNTLGGSCSDGNDGTFHFEASVDALRVSTVDGLVWRAEGTTVKVEADVWGAPAGGSTLMLFQAADANAPQWVHLATLPTTGGAETLSTTFTLPAGSLQAVRAALVDSSQAQSAPCTPGAVHDHDDLVFSVSVPDTIQPNTFPSSPSSANPVSGQVTLVAFANDNQAMGRVDFFINDTPVGSDSSTPYEVTWDSFSVPNGQVTYMVRAWDAVGNSRASSINLTVRNDYAAPTVSLIAPAQGATVGGSRSVVANASDDIGITRVEFYLDDTVLLGTSTQAQYGIPWNTQTASPGPHTLTARAYDASGKVTTSAPVSVTVDPPPTVAITSPTAGAVLTGTVSLSATATDNTSVTQVVYRPEGSTTILCSSTTPPFTCTWNTYSPLKPFPNGPVKVRAEAYDGMGGLSYSESVTYTVDNDNSPPTVTVTAPSEGATVKGAVVLSADASDDRGVIKVLFYVDNNWVGEDTTPPYSVTWTSSRVANGVHKVHAMAIDTQNGKASAPVNLTTDNDLVAPTVSLTSPAEGAMLEGTVTLSATASDDRGISKVSFYSGFVLLGTDTTPPYTYDLDTRTYTNGARTLKATAYDEAGNTSSASVNVTFDNDQTGPTLAITSPAEGATVEGTVTVSVDATDVRSGVSKVDFYMEYSWGSTWLGTDTSAPYTYDLNTRSFNNGAYKLTARAIDGKNNGSGVSVNLTVDNDKTPPTLAFTSPVEGATLEGIVTVSVDATDARSGISKVEFYLGTTLLGTDTSAPYTQDLATRNLTNGAYSLTAKAFDGLGNTNTAAVNVTVDNDFTAPTVYFTQPLANDTVQDTVRLLASASDARSGISKVEFYLGTTLLGTDTSAPYTHDLATRAYPNGAYSLTAKAYDGQGNLGTVTINVTFNNDFIAPTVSITSPAPNAVLTTGTVYTFTASASDNVGVVRVEFYLDGALLGTDTTSPYGASWSPGAAHVGNHTLFARAYDLPGNVTASTVVNMRVENPAPPPPPPSSGTLSYSASNTNSAFANTVNQTIILSAGQTLTLGTCGVTGSSYSGDTYLRLYNPSGSQVAASDDACGGAGSNFTYTVPSNAGGNYQLRAGCFSSGSCSGTVAWTITGSYTPPPPPPSGNTLTYSASNTNGASVNTTNQTIALVAGQTLTLGTCGVTGSSFSGDTYLRFYSPSGTQVASNDDACGGAGSNFTYTVPSGAGGNYQLRAGCYSSSSCGGTVAWTVQ